MCYLRQVCSKIRQSGSGKSNSVSEFLLLLLVVDLHAKAPVKCVNVRDRAALTEYSCSRQKSTKAFYLYGCSKCLV